ncbi:MAG: Flagellin D [Firmicutes bacterium ADurb.Bin354]|nr:MAG: Flagellin D [Firmicutes bacterium ADurb.Bin354]
MRINYNASAVVANKTLNNNDNLMSLSMQRLSSGLKINYAKDNPAGLAIANRMNAQIKGLGVGSSNTNDGISVVETADGALTEVTAVIQRINELAVKASTDTLTDDDRKIIQEEIDQLQKEIQRIAKDTEFNGQPLLDGTFDLKGYSSNTAVKVDYYTEDVDPGKYEINPAIFDGKDGNLSAADIAAGLTGTAFPDVTSLTGSAKAIKDINGNLVRTEVTIKGTGNYELQFTCDSGATGTTTLDLTGIGAMKIQTGANEGNELAIQIREISLNKMGIPNDPNDPERLDVSTQAGAEKGIVAAQTALAYVNSVRSKLGAYQNRLEHNAASVAVSEENMTASYSRIMDVDMAEEMTEYTTRQVLVQAGVSMLAQANERPQQVLQLLQ